MSQRQRFVQLMMLSLNVQNPHFQAIVDVWGVPETFERHYTEDYNLISGTKNDTD